MSVATIAPDAIKHVDGRDYIVVPPCENTLCEHGVDQLKAGRYLEGRLHPDAVCDTCHGVLVADLLAVEEDHELCNGSGVVGGFEGEAIECARCNGTGTVAAAYWKPGKPTPVVEDDKNLHMDTIPRVVCEWLGNDTPNYCYLVTADDEHVVLGWWRGIKPGDWVVPLTPRESLAGTDRGYLMARGALTLPDPGTAPGDWPEQVTR